MVQSELTAAGSLHEQCLLINKFIEVAQHLLTLYNFHSFFAVVTALESTMPMPSTSHAWRHVSKKTLKTFAKLRAVVKFDGNMKAYRKIAGSVHRKTAILPLLPVICKDMRFLADATRSHINDFLSFRRYVFGGVICYREAKIIILVFILHQSTCSCYRQHVPLKRLCQKSAASPTPHAVIG